MLIEGTKILVASRSEVWRALNDPAFLRRAIPGCRRVERDAADRLEVGMTVAVGPISANFDVTLQVLDAVEAVSYRLEGQGSAGPVGSARGSVRVELSDVDGGTALRYSAETETAGRIAQLGSRMIDSAARKFSEAFFANIASVLSATPEATAAATQESAPRSAVPAFGDGGGVAQALSALTWKLAAATAVGAFLGTAAALLLVR